MAGIAALLATAPGIATAQGYPNKPITFVVPVRCRQRHRSAGARARQLRLAGHQAAGHRRRQGRRERHDRGADVAKAAADGYTVLITTNTTHAANEHLFKKLPTTR